MTANAPLIEVEGLAKSFTLHLRGGLVLPVVSGVCFAVRAGECLALGGPSGIGKSSILKAVFGNYAVDAGRIWIRDGETRIDLANAGPRSVISLRRRAIGFRTAIEMPNARLVLMPKRAMPTRLASDPSERSSASTAPAFGGSVGLAINRDRAAR